MFSKFDYCDFYKWAFSSQIILTEQQLDEIQVKTRKLLANRDNDKVFKPILKPVIGGWYKTFILLFREWVVLEYPSIYKRHHLGYYISETDNMIQLSPSEKLETKIRIHNAFFAFVRSVIKVSK